jgi:hypothetical protein
MKKSLLVGLVMIAGSVAVESGVVGSTYCIATDRTMYESWPTIEQDTVNGDLYCFYHYGQIHGCNSYDDGYLSRSQDGGHTWIVLAIPFIGSHTTTPGNRYGYSCGVIKCLYYNNHLRIILASEKIYPDTAVKSCSVLKYSDDTGKTWSNEIRIDSTGGTHDAYVGVGHICQVSKTGRLIIPYFSGTNERKVYVAYCDSLQTLNSWHTSLVADSTGGIWPNESSTFELKENGSYTDQGKIVCVMRNDIYPNATYQSISNDGGLTWSAKSVFPVPFSQPHKQYLTGDPNNASKVDVVRMGSSIYFAQGVYKGELWRSNDECQSFTRITPDWVDRDTNYIWAGYYSSITKINGNQIGVAWCTNYSGTSDVYFTTYQLNPDNINQTYSFKFTLPKFSAKMSGSPIPINLSKITNINFWNNCKHPVNYIY